MRVCVCVCARACACVLCVRAHACIRAREVCSRAGLDTYAHALGLHPRTQRPGSRARQRTRVVNILLQRHFSPHNAHQNQDSPSSNTAENPRNIGALDKKDPDVGTGLVGAPACGDVMKLQIQVGWSCCLCAYHGRMQLQRVLDCCTLTRTPRRTQDFYSDGKLKPRQGTS